MQSSSFIAAKEESSPVDQNKSLPSIEKSRIQKKIIYKPFAQKLTFICKFCGGKSCKHENYLTYPESAIKGLNSDWVTSNILATQRPSSRIIKEFNVIKSFKDNGINAIFNLQEPGEHPFCGDGIHPSSGFSYFPEEFYEHGIYFFNYGWKDMTATSTEVVIKILKQMSFSLMNGNKIAIHCHAGRGRTGLIIAAWLIYHHNMTAKEAIKLVRGKRKGSIQSKSQEQVLFRLAQEIRESRIIFHSTAKFKLDDYLFHQKKLLPLSMESETRFVPNLVLSCLERLETLVSSGICSAMDVAMAFYSPNDILFHKYGEWSPAHEKALKTFKERINTGDFSLSEIEDPRLLAQGLLDYFDHFTTPAIRNQFIDAIHNELHENQSKLTKDVKDHLFHQLDKKEFLLIECFARFFSNLLNNNETLIDPIRKSALRLSISLALQRKKWDKLFLKRSLIKEHVGDDRVGHLAVFFLKWIENFNSKFSETYMVAKSPLKISEKRVQEKLDRSPLKPGTYMLKALHKDSPIHSNEESPTYPGQSSQSLTPRNRKIKLDTLQSPEKQPNQEAYSPGLSDSPASVLLSPDKKSMEPRILPAGLDYRNSANSDCEGVSNEDSKTDDLTMTPVNLRVKAVAEEARAQSTFKRSSFSPNRREARHNTVGTQRVSLLGEDSNPFALDNDKSMSKNTLNKNYDEFFSKERLITDDGNIATVEDVEEIGDTEPDLNASQLSDKDNFMDLVDKVKDLSQKKKDYIFKMLQVQDDPQAIKVEN